MARNPEGYWEKRSTNLMLRLETGTEKTIDNLTKVYNQATKNINKEINEIFRNYANDTGLSKEVLTSMLNKRESDTYYNNLLNTIGKIKNEDVRKKLLAKYNAPAYSYRINRFQALQNNIDVEIAKIADIEQTITKERYVNTIKEGYYHNIYDIQKGLGYGFNFSQVDMKTINLMLNDRWIDKGNYSSRIWKNADRLSQYLKINFTADTMSGKSISAMSKELSETLNIGLYKSTRLIRTEVNHFANESEMLSYEELGIEKYRFVATLDKVTCKHCARLDNKVFNVKDRKAGYNYPPIHPNDRCTTVAVFDDEVIEDLQRRAMDENGQYILVPQNMSYDDWYDKYVTNNNKSGIINNYKKLDQEEFIKLSEKHRDNINTEIRNSIYKTNWDNMQELNKYGYINSNYSGAINYYRRTGQNKYGEKHKKEFDKTILSLQKAIKNNRLEENIETTRYLDLDWLKDKVDKKTYNEIISKNNFSNLINKLKDKKVSENQFISTSATMHNNMSDRKIKMIIKADKGTHAFITENKMESEIIFDSSDILINEIKVENDKLIMNVKLLERN